MTSIAESTEESTGGADAAPRPDRTGAASDEESGPAPLPDDVVFGLLSAKRRRDVLEHLVETDGRTTLSDVAERIAAEENGIERQLLSSKQRKRVYVALYQCHLPKLDDADVIDFDSTGTIEIGPTADQLTVYLDIGDSGAADEGRLAGLLTGALSSAVEGLRSKLAR